MRKKVVCQHNNISWSIHQLDPDIGICDDCGKLLYSKRMGAEILTEDDLTKEELLRVLKEAFVD